MFIRLHLEGACLWSIDLDAGPRRAVRGLIPSRGAGIRREVRRLLLPRAARTGRHRSR
jgi:hypothetical protein